MSRQTTKKKRRLRPSTVIARVLIVFAVTLLLIVIALYGVMLILTHGPSESAKRLFVMSVKETSAGGFLADMCLSRDEVDAILAEKAAAVDRMQNTEQNTDLITIGGDKNDDKTPSDGSSDNSTDGSNTDNTSTAEIVAQGDGIRVEQVSGGTYNGVMMIVDDPKRVFVGIPDAYGEDKKGLSLKRLIEKYGAIGGTNAGGFADPGGMGNGGVPKGAVIKDGGTEIRQYERLVQYGRHRRRRHSACRKYVSEVGARRRRSRCGQLRPCSYNQRHAMQFRRKPQRRL